MAVHYFLNVLVYSIDASLDEYRLFYSKVKFTLEQAIKVQRGITGILYSFFILVPRWGWVLNHTPRPLHLRERDLVPIL
jgi:hypothetical protein